MLSKIPIFDFDDIIKADDRVVMDAVSKITNDDIATALIDASTSARAKVFKNMPRRRTRLIREDMIIKLRTWTPQGAKISQKKILDVVNKLMFENE
ncbi:MAG: FliG C-terminal domain-containing protein [Candidatus Poribacteria bacterium]